MMESEAEEQQEREWRGKEAGRHRLGRQSQGVKAGDEDTTSERLLLVTLSPSPNPQLVHEAETIPTTERGTLVILFAKCCSLI